MDADGTNVQRLTHGAKASRPAWSPDGKKIAFGSSLHGTLREIYVMDADGSNMKRLTDSPGGRIGSASPSWSPDGKKIGFCSDRKNQTDTWTGGIYVMDADGGNCKALAHNTGNSGLTEWNWFRPSWSPDGKKIAFCNNGGPPDNYAIWVMDADGGNKEKIIDLPGWDMSPDWSPDGKRIVFWNSSVRNAKAYTEGRIYIMDVDGGNLKELTEGRYPSWSPDGKRIVFCSNGKGVGIHDHSSEDIYVIDADGGDRKQLTDNPKNDASPDWFDPAFAYAVSPAGKMKSTWGKIKAWLRPE
jgi:TolB protein